MNGVEGDPNQNLKLSVKQDGHEFEREYAVEMLSFLWEKLGYGALEPGLQPGETIYQKGTYQEFDQREFFPLDMDWTGTELLDRENGNIYIPFACKNGGSYSCRVHFAFHGCSNVTY